MSDNASSKIEPLRLTPDIIQPTAVLVISVLLFVAGIYMVLHGVIEALYLVALFSLAIAASVITILPGSCYLEIDDTGLKIVSRFRETHYQWSQIERVGIFEIGIVKRIGIDLNVSYAGPERVPNYMKSASGYHVTVPHMTGVELENLRDILCQCVAATTIPDQRESV
ncbi:MAG: PH domain-containing protein [Planctomycetaceae bacterium]|nr:PH domain-containing protein [Planctomycetaceae bacterium]